MIPNTFLVSSVRNVTRVLALTNWNSERIAVTTQDAIKSASNCDGTRSTAGRLCIAARDDLTITADCVAFSANSWLISSLIFTWYGHGRKGEGEDGEDCWYLHFDGRLREYTTVYRDGE